MDVILSGQGIGSEIVFFINNWFTTENKTGRRFLLLDAYNRPYVLKFYERNDFAYITEKDINKKTDSCSNLEYVYRCIGIRTKGQQL